MLDSSGLEVQGEAARKAHPLLAQSTAVVLATFLIVFQSFPADAQVSGAVERAITRRAAKEAELKAVPAAAAMGKRAVTRTQHGDYVIRRWNTSLCKAADPCPLPDDIGKRFRGGSYDQVVLAEDTILYRSYEHPDGKFGSNGTPASWWKREPSVGTLAVIDNAIPSSYNGNFASHLVQIRVPKGASVYEGISAASYEGESSRMATVGGKTQIAIVGDPSKWELK